MVLPLFFSPMSESHGLEDPSWYWGPGCRLVCGGSGGATLHSAGTSGLAVEPSAVEPCAWYFHALGCGAKCGAMCMLLPGPG